MIDTSIERLFNTLNELLVYVVGEGVDFYRRIVDDFERIYTLQIYTFRDTLAAFVRSSE